MKLLCCGSRNWTDLDRVGEVLQTFPKTTTIIHGAQVTKDKNNKIVAGADWMCGEVGRLLNYRVHEYPADWSLGLSAGPRRNQWMLDKEHLSNDPIVLCLAFHDDDNLGLGTSDMVCRCNHAGIPVRVVRSSTWHRINGPKIWR